MACERRPLHRPSRISCSAHSNSTREPSTRRIYICTPRPAPERRRWRRFRWQCVCAGCVWRRPIDSPGEVPRAESGSTFARPQRGNPLSSSWKLKSATHSEPARATHRVNATERPLTGAVWVWVSHRGRRTPPVNRRRTTTASSDARVATTAPATHMCGGAGQDSATTQWGHLSPVKTHHASVRSVDGASWLLPCLQSKEVS